MNLVAMTGTPRNRFDDLRSALRWSHQPKARQHGLCHAKHHQMVIDDIVDIFNWHKEDTAILQVWLDSNGIECWKIIVDNQIPCRLNGFDEYELILS